MAPMSAEQLEQLEALKKNVKSVFQLVELETKDKRGMCDEREIPTIVRSLGLNPSQEQLRDIITELRGEDSLSGYVEFERFEKVMMRVLTEQQNDFTRDARTRSSGHSGRSTPKARDTSTGNT